MSWWVWGCRCCFWGFEWIFDICHSLHRPITAMGDIFQWVVRFQANPPSPNFDILTACQAGVERTRQLGNIIWNVDNSTQKYIYLRTSLTSDLTVLRLLNHCKSNTVRRTFYPPPPPPRMKSVITVLIGPPSHVSPLSMSTIGCGIASGQQQRSDWLGQEGSPPITVGCKTYLHLNRYLKWLLS